MQWTWDEAKLFIKRELSKDPYEGDFPKVGKYNFPQLAQINYLPELPVFPFNYLKSTVTEGRYWYHCFTAEKNFNRLCTNFKEYEEILKNLKGIISADFNLYRNYSEEVLIRNCLKNRLVDYALQQIGVTMIPTAGFAGESSWEWCFDGLPKNSTVVITTNTLYDKEAHRLFVGGVNAMVKKIQPTAIVICGKCPDWISKKFPDIQVIKIKSYSEMWHEREGMKKVNGRIRRSKRQKKNNCYRDTEGNFKVKDKNAIEVVEYYLSLGMYVAFYHEKGEYLPKILPELRIILNTLMNKLKGNFQSILKNNATLLKLLFYRGIKIQILKFVLKPSVKVIKKPNVKGL